MKGQFSDASPLSANAAPGALASADLVILVGQHCMPTVGEFAFGPDAKYIRIDQAHEDIGRNLPIDLGIVSCELAALEALADAVPAMTHDAWVAEIAAARKRFEDQNLEYYKTGLSYTDAVHPAVIAKELGDFLYRGKLPKEQTTIASGGYGIARYVRRELRGFRPGQIMNGAYQYGAIGPDVGYAVGVAAAVQLGVGPQAAHKGHPIICTTGDAGFGYTAMEIDTMAKYRLPVVVIVYNNNAWGTWTGATADPKAMPIHLFQENLRYDKLAEALGGHGEYVTRPAEFRPALERAYQVAVRERPAVGDQLPGEEGILGSRKVSARSARQDRARHDVVLPLSTGRRRRRHRGARALRRPRRLSRLSRHLRGPRPRRLPVPVADTPADARIDRSTRRADLSRPAAAGSLRRCAAR